MIAITNQKIQTKVKLSDQIEATKQQFKAIITDYPKGQPVVMINILKFRKESGIEGETGLQTYQRYGQNVAPLLKKAGGKILWSGQVNQTIIGDANDQPHAVLLVEYPSIDNFIQMATSPEYAAIAQDRILALEYGGLLASSSIGKAFFS